MGFRLSNFFETIGHVGWPNSDCEKAVIEIKQDKMNRSDKQNRLYWKWAAIIADELGYNKDEVHVVLGDKFLEKTVVNTKDKTIEAIPSTRDLKVDQFAKYLTDIDNLMAEYNISLPHPEDLYYEAMGYK